MHNQELANHHKNQGNQAFKSKNYPQAIQHFTKAIQINPNDHVFFSNRSAAYLNNHQLQQAVHDAETCIKLNPSWPRGYQRKGTALFYLDRYEQAISTYREGLKHDPNNAELLKNIEEAEAKIHAQSGSISNIFNTIMSDPQLAGYMQDPTFLPILTEIMTKPQEAIKHQSDPRVQKMMSVLQKKTNSADLEKMGQKYASQFAGAQPKYDSNVSSQPKKEDQNHSAPPQASTKNKQKKVIQDPAQNLKNKGNEQFKKKNFSQALNFYEEAIKINPKEPLYYNNKAAVYIETNQLEQALDEIRKAEKLFEEGEVKDFVKRAKVLSRKGTILSKQEKYVEAIEALQKSLLEDSNQKVKDELNRIKKLKKEKDAKQYINPQIAEHNNEQGNFLFHQGKYPQALKQYQEAVRRNPENPKYYSNIGQVYIKLMEFQKAKENYQIAIKKDPNFQKAYRKKGDCHFYLKQYHKALESYEAGLNRDPSDKLCKEGIQKTQAAIYMGLNAQDQKQRAKRAMADPQIQAILQTPQVRNALADLQSDPKALQNVLKDKSLAQKIEKLIAAGVIGIG